MSRGVFVIVIFLCLLASTDEVLGVAIGVNRADFSFQDVLREGYAEDSFVVSTDSSDLISGAVEVEGEIAEWVSFRPDNVLENGFNFSSTNPQTLTVIIQPPEDAANGEYSGTIRVLTGEIGRSGGGRIGTSTRAAFGIDTVVGITGVETRSCVLGGIQVTNTELTQDFELTYSVKNTGNVRMAPVLDVEVFNQAQEETVLQRSVQTTQEVLPTRSQRFRSSIEQDLVVGQYWARVSSPECSGSSLLTFDVLERGGVVDSGEFVDLEANSWNEVGDIIPILAYFQNTGSRTVSAKFKGTVMKNSKLFKVIDTDFYNTPPGDAVTIETFFNPLEPGRYVVEGRILYNDKLTFERSAIINVGGTSMREGFSFMNYAIIFIVLILLILIIRKKKKRRF